MNVLLVYPKFPDTYWSFRYALSFQGKRAVQPCATRMGHPAYADEKREAPGLEVRERFPFFDAV